MQKTSSCARLRCSPCLKALTRHVRAELLAEKDGRDTENVNAAKMAEDRFFDSCVFFGAWWCLGNFGRGISSHWKNSGVIYNGNVWLQIDHFHGDYTIFFGSLFERSSMDVFG